MSRGDFTAVSLVIFLLVLVLVVPVYFTFSSQTVEEEQFPQNVIASSSTDTNPHLLKLKATQQGDAEPEEVSGFNLDITNVVGAQANSQLLVFVTDSSVRIIEAKVKTVSDQLIDLVPSSQANAFSLANLPVGVYTLDVITQKGNTKAAYEGILVIGQQPRTIINEIINRETNENGDVIIILPPGDRRPTPTPTPEPTPTPTPEPTPTPTPEPTPEPTPPPDELPITPPPDEELLPPPDEQLPFEEQPPSEDEEPVTPFKKWYDEQYDEQPPPEDEEPIGEEGGDEEGEEEGNEEEGGEGEN